MAGHSQRLILGLVAVVASAVAVAPFASASPRTGKLEIYKECSEYTGLTGSFCTIKSSSLKAIKAGSKVVYLQPKSLASDVVLTRPGSGSDKAYGRCSLNKAGNGTCVFTHGTGVFEGFHANLHVSHLGDPAASPFYYWKGSYTFGSS